MAFQDSHVLAELALCSPAAPSAGDAKSCLTKVRSLKTLAVLCVVIVLTAIPHLRLMSGYFVGYDDFNEVYRAAFEDTRAPQRIVTTSHFGSMKYRPANRAMNFVTYRLGHGGPAAFRVRNIFFHTLNSTLLFAIGVLLFNSRFIGAVGALLFGWHPLTHQAVAGCVMTNTAAASLALIAVFCGLWSYRTTGKHQWTLLIIAIASAWLGILTYEADVTSLAVIFLYFLLDSMYTRCVAVKIRWALTLVLLSVAIVSSMLLMRALVLPAGHQAIASPTLIARNAAMYFTAAVLPLDHLLANQWLGVRLLSEVSLNGTIGAVLLPAFSSLCLLILIAVSMRPIGRYILSLKNCKECSFLLGSAFLSIMPLLVFNEHPSETYLYLPLGFFMLFCARILSDLRRAKPTLGIAIVALLLLSFGFATWERSGRVARCGDIAHRILTGLPSSDWRQGEWNIRLANSPEMQLPHRYGLYTYRGLDTIGTGDGTIAVQHAVQLLTGNDRIRVQLLPPERFIRECSLTSDPCYWVFSDGYVEHFPIGLQNNPARALGVMPPHMLNKHVQLYLAALIGREGSSL